MKNAILGESNTKPRLRLGQITLSPNPLKLKGGWKGSFREGGEFLSEAPRPSPHTRLQSIGGTGVSPVPAQAKACRYKNRHSEAN